jgi:hypothetical protein
VKRRRYLVLIAIGIVLFLAISAGLARVFSADDAERAAITSLVQDEARGDASGMIASITGCATSATCRTRVQLNVAALTRRGAVSILQLNTSTNFSLTSTLGTARVAWQTPSSLPIVQCVRVHRVGNALSGLRVELLKISLRIPSDSDCPPQY